MSNADRFSKLIGYLNNCEINTKKAKEKNSFKSYQKNNIIKDNNIGFDVKRFESLVNSNIINDSNRLTPYNELYISVDELISCLRKCYLQRKKTYVDQKNPYLFLAKNIENKIRKLIQEIYDFTEIEKNIISEKYKVKGKVDGIKNNNLCMIKIINNDRDDYIEKHLVEANIYANILNEEYRHKINNLTLIYIPRSLTKIKTFDIKYDSKKSIKYLNYGLLLKESIDQNFIPDDIGKTEEQCLCCPFKNNPCKDFYRKIIKNNIEKTEEKEDKTVFLI